MPLAILAAIPAGLLHVVMGPDRLSAVAPLTIDRGAGAADHGARSRVRDCVRDQHGGGDGGIRRGGRGARDTRFAAAGPRVYRLATAGAATAALAVGPIWLVG